MTGHPRRAQLAEAYAMPLAAAFHQHLITLWLQVVIVAGHHVPAQDAAEFQPACFGVACEGRGFLGLEPRLPMR